MKKDITSNANPILNTIFEHLVISGGDERTVIQKNGYNKYFGNPLHIHNRIHRGSCTCSSLTQATYNHCFKVFNRLIRGEATFDSIRTRQIRFIKMMLGPEMGQKIEFIAAPSGSYLCYLPILFAKWLQPNKPIMNLVSCPEELGSGSNTAAAGKYFVGLNQFNEPIPKDEALNTDIKVKQLFYPARDENGHIYDNISKMREDLLKYHDSHFIIGSLVIGSKSGIRDNINIIREFPRHALWVVDVCQLRVQAELIQELIDLGAVIMLTGSKFYEAPPFCGALLTPKTLINKLNSRVLDSSTLASFDKVFSHDDFPASLNIPNRILRSYQNIGLLLRWEAAVYEMTHYHKVRLEADEAVIKWNTMVNNFMKENSQLFDPMPDQKLTNNSIISFRIKNKATGEHLTFDECTAVYKKLMQSKIEHNGILLQPSIGQPVKYPTGAFLRLALGSSDTRKLVDDNDMVMDKLLLNKLKELILAAV